MRTALIAALLVSGCTKANPNVCGSGLPMRLPYEAKTADDQKQTLYGCMERWAARLARSEESAEVVSRAAFAACEDALRFYNWKLAESKSSPTQESDDQFWLRRTLFIVVQTRAGNCYPDA